MTGSRYAAGDGSDYSHRFHAGNVGDVWKHCALVALLEAAARMGPRVAYFDTHAGEGGYALDATGEWTEGIGRLWRAADLATEADLAKRYVALCRRLGSGDGARPHRYPGSPAFARALLGDGARLTLWERDADAVARLGSTVAEDSRVTCVHGDVLAELAERITGAEASSDVVVAFLDPPWTKKADWTSVPDAMARAVKASRRAWFALWYPVKSLTRPNAMIERLAAAGVGAGIVELVTTPLEHQRNRLNGSGLVLVRTPDAIVAALAAAAPWLGSRCATQPGRWSLRTQAWPAR